MYPQFGTSALMWTIDESRRLTVDDSPHRVLFKSERVDCMGLFSIFIPPCTALVHPPDDHPTLLSYKQPRPARPVKSNVYKLSNEAYCVKKSQFRGSVHGRGIHRKMSGDK